MARARQRTDESSLRFTPVNLWLALAAVTLISLGYYLLSQGSVTLAPTLLVVGYVVAVPLAIIR
ncbi:MAG: hypothetical protein OXG58_10380 [Gemmatimonadetes bacterium]|nr:hypothetical protein [Gemmatimonadota bacterium]MCY3943561.1 hypothetical protein [Gemmatimonadota bacterium]